MSGFTANERAAAAKALSAALEGERLAVARARRAEEWAVAAMERCAALEEQTAAALHRARTFEQLANDLNHSYLAGRRMAPVDPGSFWIHSKTGNPYVVIALAKLEATGEDHVVYRRVDTPHMLDPQPWSVTWIRPLREWEEPIAVPVCKRCNDTHEVPGRRRAVSCTSCPVPCQGCRVSAVGAYCAKTPCACECHQASHVYADWRQRVAPAVPRFVPAPTTTKKDKP